MNTPVADFVQRYAGWRARARLHMPGRAGRVAATFWAAVSTSWRVHGGRPSHEAERIRRRERTKRRRRPVWLWRTYITEGSSQCIRAMLHSGGKGASGPSYRSGGTKRPPGLCLRRRSAGFGNPLALAGGKPLFVRVPHLPRPAGRGAGSSPEPGGAQVYHQPDIRGMAEIPALAQVCHQHGTLLLVDNAHGASPAVFASSLRLLDLGADLCWATPPTDPAGAHRRSLYSPLLPPRRGRFSGQIRPGAVWLHQPLLFNAGVLGFVQPVPGGGVSPAPGGNHKAPGGGSGKTGRSGLAGVQRPLRA